jgi:hypothetical protein
MLGDRVRIGATGTFKEEAGTTICTYRPKLDGNGNYILAGDGTVLIEMVGGVTAGSSGTISGPAIKVNRTELKSYNGVPGLGVTDTVLVFPVMLDKYQQVGWFPNDDMKIMAGGPS